MILSSSLPVSSTCIRAADRPRCDAADRRARLLRGQPSLEVGTAPKKDYERRRRVMQEALRLLVRSSRSNDSRIQPVAGTCGRSTVVPERWSSASWVLRWCRRLARAQRCEPSSHGCLLTTTESGSTSPLRRWLRPGDGAPSGALVAACRRHGLGGSATRWCRRDGSGAALGPGYANSACTSSHGTAGIQSQQR